MSAALKLMHSSFISGVQAGAGIASCSVTELEQECRELLAVTASAGEHPVIPEVPKECTCKDMTIKGKRKVAINLYCEEIIVERLYLI